MELNDEITIPAKLDLVYKSLNDLEVLKACTYNTIEHIL